ncbi:hypothetical protein ACO0LO_08860 [Undibacterium sp. TJN25]|uniref:hypothetical protein n=1 Tax=Undibacterium sp. TJN25 TaxID=3413056 RepID=UPI003BF4069A
MMQGNVCCTYSQAFTGTFPMTTDMKFSSSTQRFRLMSVLSTCSISILLAACGGGGGADSTGVVAMADSSNLPVGSTSNPGAAPVLAPPNATPPAAKPPVVIPPVVTPPINSGDTIITNVKIQNTTAIGTKTQTNVPVTFGQIFAPGDLPNANTLYGKLSDGSTVPLQIDVKAKHADGSVRHAIISCVLPSLPSGQTAAISLIKAKSSVASAPGITASALLASGFTSSVSVTLNGQLYTASADALLKAGQAQSWLAGPLVNEWLVSAPLKNAQGVAHPQLTARFAIRSYTGLSNARVDVTLENNWAFEPAPQNLTYDVKILIGGQNVYSKSALTHYTQARWRKMFWWGQTPQVNVQLNPAYLIASKAVSNYDQSFTVSPAVVADASSKLSGASFEPMGTGMAVAYMPSTGGRGDIGLLPSWAVSYLRSMDNSLRLATLNTADLAGSWGSHYRDKNTDRPVSLMDYPYMTIVGRSTDTLNPATKKYESFPACGGDCASPNTADTAHTPASTYLPYLVTGDYYYLEELQFEAMYALFQSNPGYRNNISGLLYPNQVRAQAWMLRDVANAAYITPDSDTLKKQFATFLGNNLDWYNNSFSSNTSSANTFGAFTDSNARVYDGNTGIAPWQDDFFTSVVGHIVELGYQQAQPLLAWKVKFPIKRMTDPGFCWIQGSIYSFHVTDVDGGTIYTDMGQAYRASVPSNLSSLACASASMASGLGLQVGEMVGYSSAADGFPSDMQPALAYSADSGVAGGANAWKAFMARSVKPDYSTSPQFAIVPR